MLDKVEKLYKEACDFTPNSKDELNDFKNRFLSKKGEITSLFTAFKEVPVEQKKEFGSLINKLKDEVKSKIDHYKNSFVEHSKPLDRDLHKPVSLEKLGSSHPISLLTREITSLFEQIGFVVTDGPEIEDDWHNFSALNLPPDHPARDMQDTFFIEKDPDLLLRTHTSSVQIRHMKENNPPIRIISPGRVYRNESISSRSHCLFHQVEGLYIDKDVSFADLKQTLDYFCKKMFGENTKTRLRPSYFPFTEPSAEVDIYWGLKNDSDYRITKGTGWLEILGCGMVDPAVLENCGIDSNIYTGFAFGMGIERMAMLKYGIDDIRLFYENDIRFLKQFSSL